MKKKEETGNEKTTIVIFTIVILCSTLTGCSKSNLEITYDACCEFAIDWLTSNSDLQKSDIECSPYMDGESVTYSHDEIIYLEEYPEKEFACRVYKIVGSLTYVSPLGVEISPQFVMYDYVYTDTFNFSDSELQGATNHGIDDFDYLVIESFAGIDVSEIY